MGTKNSWKKIDLLLDQKFVNEYFKKSINKIDPEAKKITKVIIYPIKNHSGLNRHVVIFYSL